MLFRKSVVSMRMIFMLAVAMLFVASGTVAAFASNSGVAPVLVPYTAHSIGGNTQSTTGGYGGDGGLATGATFNSPYALAVDSVGNVYIADTGNAIIREINAQTGIVQTIAGVVPSKCTGVVCTVVNSGCADGVQAVGNGIGANIEGIAVDGFGNVYWADYNTQAVFMLYKSGTQVANFITLEDPTGVNTAGGVKPGYVYHVGGTYAASTCKGVNTVSAAYNNVLATSGSFHDPAQVSVDPAGNIYIEDFGNGITRVINAQSTTQTFFGVSLAPGYLGAIVNCSGTATFSFTTACATANGIGSPANQALMGAASSGIAVDRYGNVYEIDTKGADPIYAGVAYAGGTDLANLINQEMAADGQSFTANPGDWYSVVDDPFITTANLNAAPGPNAVLVTAISNLVIRPSAITTDPLGNIYFLDSHWPDIWKVDIHTGIAVQMFAAYTFTGATPANPIDCGMAQTTQTTTGVVTTDPWGDGCPASEARVSTGGLGYITFDGQGNLYIADKGSEIIREITVNNQFKTTALQTPETQTLQVHFDASNLPVQVGTAPSITTTSFQIMGGSSDFSISGTPSCSNLTTWTTGTPLEASPTTTTPQTIQYDKSVDCYVSVTFNPTLPGVRQGVLQATTANGSVYTFPLSGVGSGAQIAVDGGSPATLAATSLNNPSSVAVSPSGQIYVADTANNQVVVMNANGSSQTTIGSGLSSPQGVAVDAQGNVYISDTGNNRVIKIDNTGTQTEIGTESVYNGQAYSFSGPQGLAVDAAGNVYVADSGNKTVVEIPANPVLATAPLLQGGTQTFDYPVGVAVDDSGNVYVADSGKSGGIIKIQAGGGDLQTPSAATSIVSFGTATLSSPSGVAVDAAGDLYVSDNSLNVVEEIPSATGPGHESFAIFTGLNSPSGLALDATGNLYAADSKNNRVLFDNRSQVQVNFGTLPQYDSATIPLTVTNIGNSALAVASSFLQASGDTTDFSTSTTCNASGLGALSLTAGLHCAITTNFLPVANGDFSQSVSVQSGAASVTLTGIGNTPEASISLAVTSPAGGPVKNQDATITATVTQPHATNIPTGTMTFSYTINGVSQTPVTETLVAGSSSSTASFTIPAASMLEGRNYVINASYSGDSLDSQTNASPLTFLIPGIPVTVVANSVSYTYGSAVPNITGTVTGILPEDAASITVTFTSAATPSSAVGTYPITVTLAGGNYQNYTVQPAVTPSGAPAVVTENPAPLSIVVQNETTVYGSQDINDVATITGAVNGDSFLATESFSPASSSQLNVGTYPLTVTISDSRIKNYTVTNTPGTLTVTQTTATVNVLPAVTSVLPTNLASAKIAIDVVPPGTFKSSAPSGPTGTVILTDVFTPITPSGPSASITEPKITLNLSGGTATYTPTDTTLGTHSYSVAYSGDNNFQASSAASATNLIVDTPDYTVTSTTDPVQLLPGIIPGGVATTTGEEAAYPEQATVTVAPILGFSGAVSLACSSPSSYVTCTLSPTSVTLTGGTTSQTSVISISTPATLPLNYTSQLRKGNSRTVLAFLPLGVLVLAPLCRRKRRLGVVLWMLFGIIAVSGGIVGCGANSVKFFTPVPTGAQNVTITATSGNLTRSFIVQIEIQ
jgi:trimeric autotransporter adhesin